MPTLWHFPTRLLFGTHAAEDAGAEAVRLGISHVLIITDPGVLEAGVVSDVEKSLRRAKLPFDTFSNLSSNPTDAEALAAADAFKAAKADGVMAIGGGSAIDVGKIVRILTSHPGPLASYDVTKGGWDKITNPLPPMIAIPTTAGTGSEVGRSAVATMRATNKKTVFGCPELIPNAAILDPALTATMPAHITAATGFDALTHCIEAYCAKGDHPMADAIAMGGVDLIARNLANAVEQGDDLDARGAMLKASMMGAVAFQKGLGVCHSLAHPLSAECGTHHGLANALCLPAVLDFNRTAVPERIAAIARALGVRADDQDTLAFECSGAVRALRKQVGLVSGLAEAGIDEDLIPKLAELAMEDGTHLENPRECALEDMIALYKASL